MKWAKSSGESLESRMDYLSQVKTDLDFLNKQASEKGREYLVQFNKEYTDLSTAYNAKKEKSEKLAAHKSSLNSYYKLAKRLEDGYEIEKGKLTYKAYYAIRDAFKAEYPAEFEYKETTNKVKFINNFFEKTAYEKVAEINSKVDETIRDMYLINSYKSEKYRVQGEYHLSELKGSLLALDIYDEHILTDVSTVQALQSKTNKEVTMLEEYIKGGGIEAARAEEHKADRDAVRLDKKGMSNSTYEKMAMNYSLEDGDKVIRAVISSSTWDIEKSITGTPLRKNIYLSLGVKKKDGRCYLGYGTITREYEGGGNYGKATIECSVSRSKEMNCNNVFK